MEECKIKIINGLLWVLPVFFLISCNNGKNENSSNEVRPSRSPVTVDEMRQLKPKLSEFITQTHNIGLDQPTYIKIVTNSTQLQEVFMVYHDLDKKEWEQESLAKGSGENNNVIKDIKFEKRFGFGDRYKDLPEFYMRYSGDEGNTWTNHEIGKVDLRCLEKKEGQIKTWAAHVLVSLPLNPKNDLPDVAIVFQWQKQLNWTAADKPSSSSNFQKLCGVLEKLPLEW